MLDAIEKKMTFLIKVELLFKRNKKINITIIFKGIIDKMTNKAGTVVKQLPTTIPLRKK